MSNKLSNSSSNTYQACPQKYNLHYNKKYRPKRQSSALLFGSAIDLAFGNLLEGGNGIDLFEKAWLHQEINKQVVYLKDSPVLAYYKSDLELCLLDDKDSEDLNTWLKENTPETRNWDVVFNDIVNTLDFNSFDSLSFKKQQYYNLVFWTSLRKKGLLMIETLKEKVLPKITKVHSTQEEIKIKIGQEGDSITGFIDMVASWKSHEDDIVIFDLKTSSKPYEDDSVRKSVQLGLYLNAVGEKYQTKKCGYIVLGKKIIKNKTKYCSGCKEDGTGSRARTCDKKIDGKRCGKDWVESFNPEIMLQIIIDTIEPSFQSMVVDNFTEINKAVNSKIFVKNMQSCIMPYGKCQYYSLCHLGETSDLIQMVDNKPEEII